MTDCPIQLNRILGAMARGEAKPFTQSDTYAYSGVEGDGYTLEMDDCIVVIDIGPATIIQVMRDVEPAFCCWMWEASADAFKQIVGK